MMAGVRGVVVPVGRIDRRVASHSAIERGVALTVQVDGETITAYAGETLAASMLAAGRRTLRAAPRTGGPRGIYCGMGTCYDCLMVVDGRPNVRSCMTYVAEGMQAQTQRGPGEGAEPIPASD
jgi:D-hydroxyproline dehydrogenase subunit gamma